MDGSKISVRLSNAELNYLKQAGFLNTVLLKSLESASEQSGDSSLLNLDRSMTESFHLSISGQLPLVGFDENYELNHEGRVLDELIDRFFLALFPKLHRK